MDLLVNRKCRDVGVLLKLNRKVTSLKKGATPLGEPDGRVCKELTQRLGGFDIDHPGVCFLGIPAENEGWSVIAVIDDLDFDDHYGNYVLEEFDSYASEECMNPR